MRLRRGRELGTRAMWALVTSFLDGLRDDERISVKPTDTVVDQAEPLVIGSGQRAEDGDSANLGDKPAGTPRIDQLARHGYGEPLQLAREDPARATRSEFSD